MKVLQIVTAAIATIAAASGQYVKQANGDLIAPANLDGTCPPPPTLPKGMCYVPTPPTPAMRNA